MKHTFLSQNKPHKTITIILLLSIVILLTGCHFSANSVKLASKNDVLKYAERNYGSATFVDKESGDDFVNYVLKDKQYGFTYNIKSYVHPVGMDGSIFWYSESKYSDFETAYFDYIYTEISEFINEYELELDVDFQASKYNRESYFGDVVIGNECDEKTAIEFVKNLSEKIQQIDDRGYYQNSNIYLKYFGVQDDIGAYVFSESIFKTTEELNIEFYMSRAKQLLDTDVEYQKLEIVAAYNVPELSNFNRIIIAGNDNDSKEYITCYYFKANGKDYFITDVVIEDGMNNFRQYIYCITDKCSFSPSK